MAFHRTKSALDADGFGRSAAGFAITLALLGAWGVWFVRARVSLYEVSSTARLESARASHPIEAPLDGRLVSSQLVLGRRVTAGDELVRLESEPQTLERSELQARVKALEPQVDAAQQEISTTTQAGQDDRDSARAALEVAREQVREAEAPAIFAEQDIVRLKQMFADGLIAEREVAKGISDAQSQRAASESRRLALGRMEREQTTRDTERVARLDRLRGDVRRLEGEIAQARAAIERLDFEIDRRVIRASISGVIAEAAELKPGAFLRGGMRLGAILPDGNLRVVAEYSPAAALGRIRPGQPARLRLQGFPWMQYGSIPASVTRVAGEVRDGQVRVELEVHPRPDSAIPLQHGLPGTVEVEVEQVSPARLTMRLGGQLASQRVTQ
jgi:membrane fusion protein (multidrug efflux system)